MSNPTVLFLCTGNSARSQMGEAFLRTLAGDRFEVHSAGLEPKGMNPFTVRVMDEIGIDVRGQRSKSVREYMGHVQFNYVITVCSDADANCPRPLWSRGVKLHWPFDDPAAFEGSDEDTLARFREIRDQISARVQAWVAEMAPTS
jgi:arsenate reductase